MKQFLLSLLFISTLTSCAVYPTSDDSAIMPMPWYGIFSYSVWYESSYDRNHPWRPYHGHSHYRRH